METHFDGTTAACILLAALSGAMHKKPRLLLVLLMPDGVMPQTCFLLALPCSWHLQPVLLLGVLIQLQV
jgi:hypothetical protein